MFSLDLLTIIGIGAFTLVGVILFALCRLRGCDKPVG